jgi:hypothetical protein
MKKFIGPGLLFLALVLFAIAFARRLTAHSELIDLIADNKPESVLKAAETKAEIEFYVTGATGLLFLVTGIVVRFAARPRRLS